METDYSCFTSTFSSLVDKATKYYKYSCAFSKRFNSANIFKVFIISVVLLINYFNGDLFIDRNFSINAHTIL